MLLWGMGSPASNLAMVPQGDFRETNAERRAASCEDIFCSETFLFVERPIFSKNDGFWPPDGFLAFSNEASIEPVHESPPMTHR